MRITHLLAVLAMGLLLLPATVIAQGAPMHIKIDPLPASDRPSIALNSTSANDEQWEAMWNQVMVRNTVAPSLYPVRPRDGKGNGKAIIVVPGGGYRFVSIESEGFRVADRLAAQGYTAFVLKYRVVPTPRDTPSYVAELNAVFGSIGKDDLPDYDPAIDDLATAIAYVHTNAADYGIDPNAIGAIGFSAGARSVIRILEDKDEAKLLDHVALIYPPMTKVVQGGPRPPMFMAIAVDDPLFKQGGLSMVNAWLAESDRLEFHLYSGGDHGFGSHIKGTTSDDWINQYILWLDRH